VAVRINSVDSDQHLADIGALRAAGVRQVMLPKAESADAIARLADCSDAHIKILPLIESARGVREADAIAAAAGVFRLAFGTIDYALDLGIHGELVGDVPGFTYAAGRIANASRCAGLPSPIAGVTADVSDDAALLADLRFARSFGFGAKMCIHPRQIAVVHDAFLPSAEELLWARRVLAAAAGNDGAIKVDGKMVDRPIVARAQAMVDRLASVNDADRKEN
jgi:citrate lyase subunit beta/citryl-CoA lyase